MSVNYLARVPIPISSHYVNEIGKYTIEEMENHMRKWNEYVDKRIIEEFGRIFNSTILNIYSWMHDVYKFKWITIIDISFVDISFVDNDMAIYILLQNLKVKQIARIIIQKRKLLKY